MAGASRSRPVVPSRPELPGQRLDARRGLPSLDARVGADVAGKPARAAREAVPPWQRDGRPRPVAPDDAAIGERSAGPGLHVHLLGERARPPDPLRGPVRPRTSAGDGRLPRGQGRGGILSREVPGEGLEPSCPRGRPILNRLRLTSFATPARANGSAHLVWALSTIDKEVDRAHGGWRRRAHGGWRGLNRNLIRATVLG